MVRAGPAALQELDLTTRHLGSACHDLVEVAVADRTRAGAGREEAAGSDHAQSLLVDLAVELAAPPKIRALGNQFRRIEDDEIPALLGVAPRVVQKAQHIRSLGVALCQLSFQATQIVAAKTFPYFLESFGLFGTISIYSLANLFMFVWALATFENLDQMSLTDIEKLYSEKSTRWRKRLGLLKS